MGEIDEIGWRGEQRSSTVASWEILESQRTEMCKKKKKEKTNGKKKKMKLDGGNGKIG